MKMTFGRKFFALLVVVICLMTVILIALLVTKPSPVTGIVLIVYGSLITTMGMMYVGGNVWNTWVKSKYFKSELVEKGNE